MTAPVLTGLPMFSARFGKKLQGRQGDPQHGFRDYSIPPQEHGRVPVSDVLGHRKVVRETEESGILHDDFKKVADMIRILKTFEGSKQL